MARRPKSLLSTRSKKTKPRSPKFLDEKYTGPEPSFIDHESWSDEEIEAMFRHGKYYYNYHATAKELRKEVTKYAKNIMKISRADRLNAVPDHKIGIALCSVCKMINDGAPQSAERKAWIEDKINSVLPQITRRRATAAAVAKPTVQERMKEKISEYIAEIEDQIDMFTENKFKTDFNTYEWLKSEQIKPKPANLIAEFFQPQLDELTELTGRNPSDDLVEGYNTYKKAEIKRLYALIKQIVDDCRAHASAQKTVRKTRAKRPVSVDKQVNKVQYLAESNEYKVASISPANIIGASELWVFNVKYRKLTRYVSSSPDGFAIKGTTLRNFDTESSVTKGVRKPHDVLSNVTSGGKRVLNKIIDSINTKASTPTGRLSKDTLILKAVK